MPQVYFVLYTSELPLTPTEVTEACLLSGVAPAKALFEPLEAEVAALLQAETQGGGGPSPFAPCEGCLAGSYTLRTHQEVHLRNALVPQAYQRVGVPPAFVCFFFHVGCVHTTVWSLLLVAACS